MKKVATKRSRPASSKLVTHFLLAVDLHKITAEDARAAAILDGLVKALVAILNGSEPDEALSLTRQRGPAPDPRTLRLATLIEIARRRGDDWSAIEFVANAFREKTGQGRLSLPRLKKLHKEHEVRVQGVIESARMLQGTNRERMDRSVVKLLGEVKDLERFVTNPSIPFKLRT